jgi:hypothetical protein
MIFQIKHIFPNRHWFFQRVHCIENQFLISAWEPFPLFTCSIFPLDCVHGAIIAKYNEKSTPKVILLGSGDQGRGTPSPYVKPFSHNGRGALLVALFVSCGYANNVRDKGNNNERLMLMVLFFAPWRDKYTPMILLNNIDH